MRGPWHIWLVGIGSLLWNAGGAYDYLMTKTGNQTYLAMLTEAQQAFLDGAPLWFNVCWALGVWGSVLGSLMILLRSRTASAFFVISLAGLLGSSTYSLFLADPSAIAISGTVGLLFSLAILVVLVLLLLYSRIMTRRGYLS